MTDNGEIKASTIKVMVTRPSKQADGLIESLTNEGVEVKHLPMLEIAAIENEALVKTLKNTLKVIDKSDFAVFISSNAVRYTASFMAKHGLQWPPALSCIPIGTATARTISQQGWQLNTAFENAGSSAQNSEALLAHKWAEQLENKTIALFRGVGGRELLAESFRQRGAKTTYIETYQRHKPQYKIDALKQCLNHFLLPQASVFESNQAGDRVIIFNSAETLENFVYYIKDVALEKNVFKVQLVVPSNRVAKRAKSFGFKKIRVAANASSTALVEAVKSNDIDVLE